MGIIRLIPIGMVGIHYLFFWLSECYAVGFFVKLF